METTAIGIQVHKGESRVSFFVPLIDALTKRYRSFLFPQRQCILMRSNTLKRLLKRQKM